MAGYNKKIEELEDRIAGTKYNKKTQHAIGQYKAQIAMLKDREVARSGIGKGGGTDTGYTVRRSGDGTVILLGFPSVGKSTILNTLTDAGSETGSYAFTTLTVIPGMLEYKHAKIQILDVPGIVKGAASGRGRGKEVLACIRSADLVLMVIDALHPEHLPVIQKEIRETGIRIDQRKPIVKITKKAKDGINFGSTVRLTKIDSTTVKSILKEFKISNADVVLRTDVDIDQFIDAVEGNKKYLPSLLVINKIDLVDDETREKLIKELKPDLCISASEKEHIDELRDAIFDKLGLIRLYLKEPSKPADMKVPLITFKNCSIEDVCRKLHKDFVEKFKFARVWGKSAKFDGQKLMKAHRMKDKDILELHIR